MTTRLSQQNLDELWDEGIQKGSITRHSDNGDRIDRGYLEDLCQVYDRQVQLRNGLCIHVYNHKPLDTLIISEHLHCSTNSGFALSFFVTGDVNTTLHPIVDDVAECAGKNYLCCHSGVLETEEWRAGQKILRVRIGGEPQHLFKTFGRELVEQLSPELQSLVTRTELQPYYYLGTTTLQMQQAVRQILNCPYQSLMKQIYLESKALELIALRFAQFMEDSRQTSSKTRLKKEDIDRIHWAKDILTNNITNPPSLVELARQVGINDYKLKQGFQQVFGTTAFGYLHHHRLEQARLLLLKNQLSIAETAYKVGYTNPCAFSKAFRKKFGVNPKSYQRTNFF